jgi:pyruvate/2-oxoglutarate dehydrogenase complex dihydrolipoamide acyltransferase (E2) component
MAHQILVPPLGQTTDTVVLSARYKQVGDSVQMGEPLFAIETDKATLDIEAQASGVLVQALAQNGDMVTVLSSIGVIAAPGEPLPSPDITPVQAQPVVSATPVETRDVETRHGASLRAARDTGRVFISPRARRLADVERVAWRTIQGTGPQGAIVERDVRTFLQAMAQPDVIPSSPATGPQVPSIAPMTAAIEVAYQQLTVEIDARPLLALCQRYEQRGLHVAREAVLLSVLAGAVSAQLSPQADEWGVGVLKVGPQGLLMPVIRRAVRKRLVQLSNEIDELAARCQAGQYVQEDGGAVMAALFDLGAYRIDTLVRLSQVLEAPLLTLGRVQNANAGEARMWLGLGYTAGRLDDVAALRLLQQVVQWAEDPDLLF